MKSNKSVVSGQGSGVSCRNRPSGLLTWLKPCFYVALFTIHCSLFTSHVFAEVKSSKPPKAVKVDFKEVELPVFIRLVSDMTGKNFTFDEKVTGKVTVISPKEVSIDELYQLFLSVLQFKGYAAVPTDNLIQIIPLSDAKQNWTQVLTEEGKGEGFVTRLIPLNFLNANEGIKVLTPLISKNGVINAYTPTNTVILTDTAMNVERLVSLLSSLDKEPSPGKGKINVYSLENADAEDLAKTLTNLFSKQPPAGAQPGGGAGLTGPVNVTADKSTNSLIITAAPEDYDSVKGVIEKLDLRRRQVYVEAAIMEISLSKMKELGVEFRAVDLPKEGSVTPFGGTNFGGIGAAVSGPAGLAELSGMAAGVVKGTFTFRGTEYLNVGALVRALQTEGDVNVLSTPHLLTTDNQKAEIVVGENVPFVTGQSQTSGGNVLTSIERKDIGITLRLTPRVSEGSFVKLDLYQEISSLTESAAFDPNKVGPVVNKRYASTTVVAKDGETIAIGGLLRDNETKIVRKVPILGDIPVLGWLFRYKRTQVDKTNLLIFITPTIVKDTTLSEMTERKKAEMDKAKGEMEGKKQ
ncbi:MAG: secretin N-terminal domain-containing protein [Deltaproteobacteria bacterium]|nr:secretin N-terminal domain-containing protein [Deltaproteobacteria bacterium]